jgi:hypothetical protein
MQKCVFSFEIICIFCEPCPRKVWKDPQLGVVTGLGVLLRVRAHVCLHEAVGSIPQHQKEKEKKN